MGIIQTQVQIHFEIEMETHGQLLEIEQTQWLNPIDLILIDLESVSVNDPADSDAGVVGVKPNKIA